MDVRVGYNESWVLKNWCFWTVVWEKTLENPLDGKKIKPVYPKGNQPWIFIRRTDAEAQTPILWPPDVKNWLIGKDHDAGKDGRQKEKGMTEDEMVEWHTRVLSLLAQASLLNESQARESYFSPCQQKLEGECRPVWGFSRALPCLWGKVPPLVPHP